MKVKQNILLYYTRAKGVARAHAFAVRLQGGTIAISNVVERLKALRVFI